MDPGLEAVFAAHGGLPAFRAVERLDLRLSTGGLAFSMRKVAHPVAGTQVTVFPARRKTVLHDWPAEGTTATWKGDVVTLQPRSGPLERRAAARAHAAAASRWDDLDLLYFVGYAIWNYLSFPFLLRDASVEVRSGGRLLAVRFPEGYPTHSSQQYFRLSEAGLLLRHDYVAEVFGGWASAANHCEASEEVQGLRFYTRRRVTPALGRSASLPFPLLVSIHVDDLRVTWV